MYFKEIGRGSVDSIKLAECRGQWWTFVSTVMKLRYTKTGHFILQLNNYQFFNKDPVSWSIFELALRV